MISTGYKIYGIYPQVFTKCSDRVLVSNGEGHLIKDIIVREIQRELDMSEKSYRLLDAKREQVYMDKGETDSVAVAHLVTLGRMIRRLRHELSLWED